MFQQRGSDEISGALCYGVKQDVLVAFKHTKALLTILTILIFYDYSKMVSYHNPSFCSLHGDFILHYELEDFLVVEVLTLL